jgi:hypothetical protein
MEHSKWAVKRKEVPGRMVDRGRKEMFFVVVTPLGDSDKRPVMSVQI